MNFLIVDDDPIICAGTMRRLRNMQLSVEISMKEAYSGEDALEWMRRHRVDVLITDIRMAGMDGLTLIEEAKKCKPDLLCLIITAYDDFSYAKRAIPLGVVDFLVKPLSESEMQKRVLEIVDRYHRLQADRGQALEHDFCRMCEGRDPSQPLRPFFAGHGVELPPGEIYILAWENAAFAPEAPQGSLWAFVPAEHSYALCISHEAGGLDVAEWAETIVHASKQSVGVSEPVSDAAEGYAQASRMLGCRWYHRNGAVYRAGTNPNAYSPESAEELSALVEKLHGQELGERLNELFQRSDVDAGTASAYLKICIEAMERAAQAAGMEDEYRSLAQPYVGWQRMVERLVREIDRIRSVQASSESYRVMCAKKYVQEHLCEPIDMAVVANQLDLSYAYFSRIFRKETGQSFTEYLLERRLEEACRLMLKGDRLVDIAIKLGYQNAGNLTRSFTRKYGMSPSKWLKKNS